MPMYSLYTFGAHQVSEPRPCHPSTTSDRPCQHITTTKQTRKPTFCPLALHANHQFTSTEPIRLIDAVRSVLQIGDTVWFPSLRLDTQMTFHNGRVRPTPGSLGYMADPIVEGPAKIQCDLLTQGHQVLGVAAGTLQEEPSLILFSNGELRVLRSEPANNGDPSAEQGCLLLDTLNDMELQAIEVTGLQLKKDSLISIIQTIAAGPVTLLTKDGFVYELPWKDMSTGKLHSGGKKSLAQPITEMCSGWDKIVALTEGGQVWVWQANKNPIRVDIPSSEEITAVRAGGSLGVAITKKGEAWAWALSRPDIGHEKNPVAGAGRDWLPGANGMIQPNKLRLPTGAEVHTFSVGIGYLAMMSRDGTWYAAGDGRYGQLGLGERLFELEGNADVERGDEYVSDFAAMDFGDLPGNTVQDVGCGANVTWVVAADKNATV